MVIININLFRSRGCENVVKITDNLEAQNTSSLKRAEEYLLTEKKVGGGHGDCGDRVANLGRDVKVDLVSPPADVGTNV